MPPSRVDVVSNHVHYQTSPADETRSMNLRATDALILHAYAGSLHTLWSRVFILTKFISIHFSSCLCFLVQMKEGAEMWDNLYGYGLSKNRPGGFLSKNQPWYQQEQISVWKWCLLFSLQKSKDFDVVYIQLSQTPRVGNHESRYLCNWKRKISSRFFVLINCFVLFFFVVVLVLVVNSGGILCHCVRIFSDHPGSRMCEPRAKLHPGVRIVHLTNLDLTEIAHRIGVTFTSSSGCFSPCFSKGSHENLPPTRQYKRRALSVHWW